MNQISDTEILVSKYKQLCKSTREVVEKSLRVSSSVNGKPLSAPPSGREWARSWTANLGGVRMNPGIKILPLPRANGLPGGRMNR